MSRTRITADMVGDPESPLVGAYAVDGEDAPRLRGVITDSEATMTKTVRLPIWLVEKGLNDAHPNGFSGVVKDALINYLEVEPNMDEVQKALRTIERAVISARRAA